jgi:hypothetical protein
MAAIGLCLLLGSFVAVRVPSGTAVGKVGVVQSSGAISVAKVQGGTREVAAVLLTDGNVVTAYVTAGGPLAPGDRVKLLEQPRTFGGPLYQVVAKDPAQ